VLAIHLPETTVHKEQSSRRGKRSSGRKGTTASRPSPAAPLCIASVSARQWSSLAFTRQGPERPQPCIAGRLRRPVNLEGSFRAHAGLSPCGLASTGEPGRAAAVRTRVRKVLDRGCGALYEPPGGCTMKRAQESRSPIARSPWGPLAGNEKEEIGGPPDGRPAQALVPGASIGARPSLGARAACDPYNGGFKRGGSPTLLGGPVPPGRGPREARSPPRRG
jgi:hypothetical protein